MIVIVTALAAVLTVAIVVNVSKSYYSVNTGMPCASIFFPMYVSDDICGVFAVDIKLDSLQRLVEQFCPAKVAAQSFLTGANLSM